MKGYIFWEDQIIPMDEVARMLKSNNTIYIQLYDKEVFELHFEEEEFMETAYDELMMRLEDGFYDDIY